MRIKTGKTSRMSSASSGCRRQYSSSVGRSPPRWRCKNSSANASTGLRSLLLSDDVCICGSVPREGDVTPNRGHQPSFMPGIDERISLSRFKARMYRLLAALLVRPSTSADLLVAQKLEVPQVSTSRSVGSMLPLSALLEDQLVLGADSSGDWRLVILPRSCGQRYRAGLGEKHRGGARLPCRRREPGRPR